MRHFLFVLCLVLFVAAPDAEAQGQQRRFRGGSVEKPVMQAFPMDLAPTLDGRVSLDPAWSSIPPSSGFTQTAPTDSFLFQLDATGSLRSIQMPTTCFGNESGVPFESNILLKNLVMNLVNS